MDEFVITAPQYTGVINVKINRCMLNVNETFETEMCKLSGIDGVEWAIRYRTRVQNKVNRALSITCVPIFNKQHNVVSYDFFYYRLKNLDDDWTQFSAGYEIHVFHEKVMDFDEDITIMIKFVCQLQGGIKKGISNPTKLSIPLHRLVDDCNDDTTDFEFVVGNKTVKVHKGLLLMVSPVFNSMLKHDTKESRNARLEITDFDYKTIQSIVDLLYGRNTVATSIAIVIKMLQFAKKYFINGVSNLLKPWLLENLTEHGFFEVVKHAWDFNDESLMQACANFYYNHLELALTPEFRQLDHLIIVELSNSAAKFQSQPIMPRPDML